MSQVKVDHNSSWPKESIDAEMDRIFDLVDKMCWKAQKDGSWDNINDLLIEAESKNYPVVLRISWLTITNCVRSKLPYRKKFFNKTYEMAMKEGLSKNILDGLE